MECMFKKDKKKKKDNMTVDYILDKIRQIFKSPSDNLTVIICLIYISY